METRKYFGFGILALLFSCGLVTGLFAEEIILPELVNPNEIKTDSGRIYITDGTTVKIYRFKDYKLIKQFGKTGEGPVEFMGSRGSGQPLLSLDITEKYLWVNSAGKISCFTKSGEYVKEIKTRDNSRRFIRFGGGFVGNQNLGIENTRYRTLNLYDAQLRKVKLLLKRPHSLQGRGGGFNPIEGPQSYGAAGDRLYVAWEQDFSIRVYNLRGNLLKVINRKYEREKITPAQKRQMEHNLKTHPRYKELYPFLKPLNFSEYIPAIGRLEVSKDRLLIVCFRNFFKRTILYILDLEGRLQKKIEVNLKTYDERSIYPFAFQSGVLFQLVPGGEDEDWRLVKTTID